MSRNPTLFGRLGIPKSVECASIDVRQIVSTVIATKVAACSTLANRHQRCQRAMFVGVRLEGERRRRVVAASSTPVTGLTSRGT